MSAERAVDDRLMDPCPNGVQHPASEQVAEARSAYMDHCPICTRQALAAAQRENAELRQELERERAKHR